MQAITPITPLESGTEMFMRPTSIHSLFPPRTAKLRPLSTATEIFDTSDMEDEDEHSETSSFDSDSSEFEEDAPDFSFGSAENRKSQVTISTIDEISTPRSSRRNTWGLRIDTQKSVEGPRGPHLFSVRSSRASSEYNFEYALQMSPLQPKDMAAQMASPMTSYGSPFLRSDTAFRSEATATPNMFSQEPRLFSSAQPFAPVLETESPRAWAPYQVAIWMQSCGIEESIIDQFEHNDITGAILMDLQFDNLKDLGIHSFGKRHQLWSQIEILRGGKPAFEPAPTPFQDISRPCTRTTNALSKQGTPFEDLDGGFTPVTPGGGKRRKNKAKLKLATTEDVVGPDHSVSIVAIEQLIPKPHKCAKGEKCAKWKKQQKLLQKLHEEHGFPISPEKGGRIFIAGNPGNAVAADRIVENVRIEQEDGRGIIPSFAASSDVLGPSQMPGFSLRDETLSMIESRDPQESVKQFLTLQGVEQAHMIPNIDEPSTPPPEMFPPLTQPSLRPPENTPAPLSALKNLPRLNIPRSQSVAPPRNPALLSAVDSTFSPCRTATASPLYRFGTPASEMDVPLTLVPQGPIARDVSQSVPPSMQFRDPVARTSFQRDWRRPSMILPPLAENAVFNPTPPVPVRHNSHEGTVSLSETAVASPINDSEKDKESTTPVAINPLYPDSQHVGWMKKRKTKMLRHEWTDQHCRLAGSTLAMHATSKPSSKPHETIDVDNYTVGCSSLSSNKLAAKLKAMNLKHEEKAAAHAFTFQLIPEEKKGDRKAALNVKTHHFAVKNRDERIDWMRELMLAKALKAKGEGYEVEVNGRMV